MDYQKQLDYRNNCNPYAKTLGLVTEEIGPGYTRLSKVVTEADVNSMESANGGLYLSVADNACGAAASSDGYLVLSISCSYNFFKGAKVGDTLIAEARVTKPGKTITATEVSIRNQKGELLGTGAFTFFKTDKKFP